MLMRLRFKFGLEAAQRWQNLDLLEDEELMIFCWSLLHHMHNEFLSAIFFIKVDFQGFQINTNLTQFQFEMSEQ